MSSTSNLARILAGVILVSQAVIAYLITQQTLEFGPVPTVVLGALSVGLTALALYLNVRMPGAGAAQ